MKNRIQIFLLTSFIILSACKNNTALEKTLDAAGSNRVQLEKVLIHYKENDPDPLKYKAASFLISNMLFSLFRIPDTGIL